ncbi:1-phosphofructokinase family hexose kinase [uncultured Corynebacterium sp.]|uniref:1-phosphofructokinase family hexose kinase n=1 Tax=uncultured Corynebacterium sp. TaxID=159447 RepID=UPI002631F7FE|nr:1-phosphofructokinase family hexose kinase [uncultured Corynebacterium sp.]
MILTLTVNPSIDRLARLDTELKRGGVFRLPMSEDMAGGKGINVSKALHYAGEDTLALYPASDSGKFSRLLEVSGIPHDAINTTNEARVNLTLAEPDGTTTKLNSPGMTLTKAHRRRVLEKLIHHAKRATWVVFAGSLPPGVPRDFYVQCTEAIYSVNPEARIAMDTSDGPLTEVVRAFPKVQPFLMKPNAYELGQIIDEDGAALEAAAAEGNYLPVAKAARTLNELGVPEVLATLGEAGAVLSVKSGSCFAATSPSIVAQSTVGAGDCALAGYVMARQRGDSYQDALANAVAYGAAATSLPGTTIPYPEQVHPDAGQSWQLDA